MAEPAWIDSRLLQEHGCTALFTLRHGGISPAPFDTLNFGSGLGDPDHHIETNLERLSRATGLAARPHQTVQAHGTKRRWLAGAGRVHREEADILLTGQPGTALAVRSADCLPILLTEPGSGLCAAVHAGWRGTAARVAMLAVQEMQSRGARSEQILASLGPCIGPCCFHIGAAVADSLVQSAPGSEAHVRRHAQAMSADLQEINRLQLRRSGLKYEHIEHIPACTCCDAERFFSYRRDGGRAGRHLAVVALPGKP